MYFHCVYVCVINSDLRIGEMNNAKPELLHLGDGYMMVNGELNYSLYLNFFIVKVF